MSTPTQWAATPNQRETQLLGIVDELKAQVQELTSRTKGKQVLPGVREFSGKAKDWDVWSMSMKAKLRVDGAAIGNKEAQFFYVYSSLSTKVQALMLPVVQKGGEDEEWDPDTLVNHLRRTYDDPNKKKKAGQSLIELSQGNTHVSVYIPQFERVLFEAGADTWPDDAKITTLVSGLNRGIRHRIDSQASIPITYNNFVRMLQTLGNQFGEGNGNGNGNNGNVSNGNGSNGNGKGNSGMDWVRTAGVATAVSKEKRQQWRDQGRCVRCGSKDHWIKDCSHRPTVGSDSESSSDARAIAVRSHAVRVSSVRFTPNPTDKPGAPGRRLTARRTGPEWGEDSEDDYDDDGL